MIKELKYQFFSLFKFPRELDLIITIAIGVLALIHTVVLLPIAQYVNMSHETAALLTGVGYAWCLMVSLLYVMYQFIEFQNGAAQYRITLGSSYKSIMMTNVIINIFITALVSLPILIFTLMTGIFSNGFLIQLFVMILCFASFIYFLYMIAAGISGKETISRNIITLLIGGFGYVFVNGLTLANPDLFFIRISLINDIWFYVPLAFAALNLLSIWFYLPRLKWMRQSVETGIQK